MARNKKYKNQIVVMVQIKKPVKKISGMRVSVAKRKGIAKKNSVGAGLDFHERIIRGVGKPITQRTYFFPNKNLIMIRLTRQEKIVGKLNIGVKRIGNYSEAFFTDAFVQKTMRNKGLYTQIVAEALDLLKKTGVNYVRFEATGGFSVLQKMGFSSKTQFGDKIFWKELNPVRQ